MQSTRSFLIAASLVLTASLQAGNQDISLKAGALHASVQVPEAWGQGTPFTQADSEQAGVFLRMPDTSMEYSGVLWKGLAPTEEPSGSVPLMTIALVPVPAKFEDDEGSRLPENDRPERSLTKDQKLAVFAPLRRFYDDSAVDVEHFRADGKPAPKELYGGWWGNDGFGTQNILDVQFLENADKSLRGIIYFYTDASDLSFAVATRILLYNPTLSALLIMDFPLYSYPEAVALEKPIINEVEGAYATGEVFYRNRKVWADSPMGKMVAAMESGARSAKLD
jgi:hypothetical protein